MKRTILLLAIMLLFISIWGCTVAHEDAQIAATTLPVYEFTKRLCEGTDIKVVRLVTDNVSCLHDYSLQPNQMRAIEKAQLIIISGVDLEAFLDDVLTNTHRVIDASVNIPLKCYIDPHQHDHDEENPHCNEHDPHIWLSPSNAKMMTENIFTGLISEYPEHSAMFQKNFTQLNAEFDTLEAYATTELMQLSCRKIITFHDGFSYMADAFRLSIVRAIEEESGSEASSAELIELINTINEHGLNVIFTERSSGASAADIISAETGAQIYQLDMAMAGDNYFDAMYHNIDTLKEALE